MTGCCTPGCGTTPPDRPTHLFINDSDLEPGRAWLAFQSARSMAYQATTVPVIASSPWKRRPHFSITRRHALLVAMWR